MNTIGLHPKVITPVLVLAALGVALILVGALAHHAELVPIGITVLGASGITGTTGLLAGAAPVATTDYIPAGANEAQLDQLDSQEGESAAAAGQPFSLWPKPFTTP